MFRKQITKIIKVIFMLGVILFIQSMQSNTCMATAFGGMITFDGAFTEGFGINLSDPVKDGTTNNGTFHDGTPKEVTISDAEGIDIEIFCSSDGTNKSGTLTFVSDDILKSITAYKPSENNTKAFVIKSTDGTDFSLNSIDIDNRNMSDEYVYMEGWREGAPVTGKIKLTLDQMGNAITFNGGNGLGDDFNCVDKVAIYQADNSPVISAGLNNILIGEPEKTPPELHPDTALNSVDHDLEITFADDAAFRAVITGITCNGNTLTASQYDVTQAGKIILKPSIDGNAYLRTPGIANIVITATGYNNSSVSQRIIAGTVESLEVITQPVPGSASGDEFHTGPLVKLKDQYGNYCITGVSASANVVATAKSGTGSWNIGGTITKAAMAGTSTFSDLTCTLTTVGNGSITFTSELKTIDSSVFTIPQKSAKVLTADTVDNSVDNDLEITFADDAAFRAVITGITCNGNTLTASQYDVTQAGKIILKPSIAGNVYLRNPGTANIVITATGYNNSSVSQTINAGAVDSLEITTQPVVGAASGDTFATQPIVKLKDQYGNYCTTGVSASANLVATAKSGTGSWNIGGTITKAAMTGTVTFTDLTCELTALGTGSITFTSGVKTIDSSAFTIPQKSAKVLTADTALNSVDNDLEITFVDEVAFRTAITSITYNGNTLTASQYDVTQAGKVILKPSVAGNAYLRTPGTANIVITATGYNNSSVAQTLIAGAVASLEITTQPVIGAASGDTFATQPIVKLKDQYGNYCTTGVSASANLVATAKSGTGSWNIGGTVTKAAAAGTVIFTDLTCDLLTVGNGSITFTSGATIDSIIFNIPLAGIEGLLADTTSNDVDHDIELTFTEDATFRNNITSITYGGNSLTASQYDITQAGKIILKPSINGNVYLRTPGTANVVITASGYGNAVIAQTLNAGTIESLEVTTQPVIGAAGGDAFATQPVVKLKDQYGNYCTTGVSASANVVATAKSGTGSWSIGGTTTKAATAGTSTFTDLTCTLTTVGNGSITFTSGIKTIDSISFILPNKNAKTLTSDTALNSVDNDLEITFVDEVEFRTAITSITYNGNALTASQYDVTQAGKVILKPSVAGNAYLRTPGTANIVITATGYNNSTVSQTINAGEVEGLEVTTQPVPGTASGNSFATQPVVKLKDQYGNYCTTGVSATANVVATATSGTGIWSIGGTTTKAASAGTAIFTDLTSSIITIGTGVIHFESGVIQVNSQSFNIPEIHSNVSSAALTFDKYTSSLKYKDLEIQVNYNGNTLNNIKNGTTILTLGTDYSVSGSSIIVKKEFLAKFLVGSVPLTFNFSQGNAPIITAVITDSKPVVVAPTTENDTPSSGGNSAATQIVPKQPSTQQPSTQQPSTQQGADILVNGKKENAGISVTSKKGTISETLIIVDEKKIEEKLKQEGQGAVVTIPVISSSDVIAGELNGQIIKNMENKEATIKIQTEKASYTLAASQINISDISKQLGNDLDLTDIKVKIEIAKPQSTMIQSIENASQKGNFTVMVEPIDFTVTCTINEKAVKVTNFNTYVERTVKLPEGIDINKITTGIVIDEFGNSRHVPTKVIEIDGAYYAQINSLTNSTYAVIWNPKTFDDMENHWAKAYANEMGSRKVVSGVDGLNYNPDKKVTRAEFTTMIVNALGLKPSQEAIKFGDVNKTDWYYGHIVTAIKYKLIDGYDENTFAPNKGVTRQEAVKIIEQALVIAEKIEKVETEELLKKYKDSEKISTWAKDGIGRILFYNIIEGDEQELRPLENLTRAEAAKMILKMLQTANLI